MSTHGDHHHDHDGAGTAGPSVPQEEQLDCSAVIADVWLFLDHECDEASRSRLQRHLDDCGPCLTAFGIEEQVKLLVSRKCGGDRAPEGLRDRIRSRVGQTGPRA